MNRPYSTVVVLDGSVAVTGAFISARDMARALKDNVDVILLTSDSASFADFDLSDFAAVHRLPIRPLRRNFKDVSLYLPRLVRTALHLRRRLSQYPSSVLLVNDFYLIEAPLLRFLGHRAPIFTWVRIDPSVFGRVGRLWLHLSSRLSNRIIAVSRHIQSLLPERMDSSLLYDPISAEFLPSPQIGNSDQLTFVFVGNYINGKGQDVAIAAFSQVLSRFPNSRLHFYGGDMGLSRNRAYREGLEAQAASLGVADAITFGDFVKNPRSVLEGAFVALNLSRSESFSRTVLEASACGLPVIATRCGGPAEIVRDGETGIMIPVDNVAACVEAMHSLCIDPDRAAKMGAAGRERVMKVFSPQAFSQRLQTLLAET